MLDLIWGLLNIAILIYFIIICFKTTIIVREKLGKLAVLIFVFGLLSFIGKPAEMNKTESFDLQSKSNENLQNLGGDTFINEMIVEDNLLTKIRLNVSFKEINLVKRAINANSTRDGFVSGTDWKPSSINVSKVDENSFQYNLHGVLEWKLLSVKIYSENKEFKGMIEIPK